MSVRVERPEGRSGRIRFERIAENLNGASASFVPPCPGAVAKFLGEQSVFHREHGRIVPFIAVRDGRDVGRIAAIVNRSHNRYWDDCVGFFGFFECENDPETARALFDHAGEELKNAGLTAIRGPYNPSINDECGLLVEGFETPPCIGLTWNPPFYERLVTGAGLGPVCTSFGLDLPLAELQMPERLERLAGHVARRSKMHLRPIDLAKIEKDLQLIRVVYNDTLSRNWGFVPITMEDMLGAANDLRTIANPEMILIAERDGEPAGIALSLPNFNELLIRLKPTPHWLRPMHLLWLMKTRRIRMARQVVYGIHPEFRDRGLHAWLLHEQFRCAKENYQSAELGWIEADNLEILENSRMVGGVQRRTWRIYEKAL